MIVAKEKRPRGRPRPKETVERDEAILKFLRTNGPQTNNAIMDHFGLPRMVAWLSLDRLRKQGLVRTCAQQGGPGVLWSADVKNPCP